MSNKQAYIDFILNELNKGNVKHNDVMSVFVSKWQLSERQFTRYWKQANEIYTEQRQAIQKEKQAVTTETEKKAVKSLVLDKIGRMKIAEQIALESDKDIDKLKALDYLSKIEGDYAPEKKEHTGIISGIDITFEKAK